MTMQIDNAGPAVRAEEIAELEARLGEKLPDAYRQFLLQTNGGAPTPDVIDVPGAPGSPTDIQVFFGFSRSVSSSNLPWNLDLIAERRPSSRVLPIACDSGGNLFCLDFSRSEVAPILYCDLDDGRGTFYLVAPSFNDFLQKIRD